jgi:high-affinity iron transporter
MMTQISIVIFREILEISLILSILSAATKDVKNSKFWILSGLFLGIFSSIILAIFTDKISSLFDGMGQEIFNGSILLLASLTIAFTVIWMQKHAKSISSELKQLSSEVKEGKRAIISLSLVVFLSVLREGAEVVLFCYSYFVSGESIKIIFSSLLIGIAAGSIVGFALYKGILKTFGRYFFQISTYLLIFLAASIASQSVQFFINAGAINSMTETAFDSSSIISQKSFFGKILNIFFGYVDQPSIAQLLVYSMMILILFSSLKIVKSKR